MVCRSIFFRKRKKYKKVRVLSAPGLPEKVNVMRQNASKATKKGRPSDAFASRLSLCYDVTNDKNSSWCSALYTIYTIISFF